LRQGTQWKSSERDHAETNHRAISPGWHSILSSEIQPMRLVNFVSHAVAALALIFPAIAPAQEWPSKAVRIVVAYPPGGGIDVMGRQLAEKLTRSWGQPVVVENKPGANTILATDSVAKSTADGHTILLPTDATFSINPHL
jgi:tripartite-type tricarboxylate transporter receptor subunit TctC